MAGTPLKLVGALAKIEGTYGTDSTPTVVANGIRLAEIAGFHSQIRFSNAFPNFRTEVASGGLMEPIKDAAVGRMANIRLVWEMKGFGSAYSAANRPEADPLFRACAWAATVVTTGGAEKITYAPVDTGIESCTIWAYSAGMLYKVVGCRGTFTWQVRAGRHGTVVFEMQGLVTAAVATTALPAITYSSVMPPAAKGVALTIVGGTTWTPDFEELDLEAGMEVQRIDDGNGTDGLQGFEILGRTSVVKIKARTEAVATYDAHGQARAATSTTIDLTLGATQYNKAKLDVDVSALEDEPENVDYQGTTGWQLAYRSHTLAIVFD